MWVINSTQTEAFLKCFFLSRSLLRCCKTHVTGSTKGNETQLGLQEVRLIAEKRMSMNIAVSPKEVRRSSNFFIMTHLMPWFLIITTQTRVFPTIPVIISTENTTVITVWAESVDMMDFLSLFDCKFYQNVSCLRA